MQIVASLTAVLQMWDLGETWLKGRMGVVVGPHHICYRLCPGVQEGQQWAHTDYIQSKAVPDFTSVTTKSMSGRYEIQGVDVAHLRAPYTQ